MRIAPPSAEKTHPWQQARYDHERVDVMNSAASKTSRDVVVQVRYSKGFASLAAFIAADPGKSTTIYRRFDRLSARNLLHLQSELIELEAQQDALDAQYLDPRTSTTEKESASDWRVLKDRASKGGHAQDEERLKLTDEISTKLQNNQLPVA